MTYYLSTLTDRNGMSEELIDKAKKFFKTFDWCLACHEKGKSDQNDHIHACVRTDYTCIKLRRHILKEVYGKASRDEVSPNMLRVEKVKNITDTVNYISKDVAHNNYMLRVGMPIKWIQDHLEKKHAQTKYFKNWKYIKYNQAPGCIIDYAKVHNLRILCKEDFKNIVKVIAKNVDISGWLKHMEWIYSQTMLELGDDSYMDKMLDNALRFLDSSL